MIDPPGNSPLKDVIEIVKHKYIEGTLDGGLVPLLPATETKDGYSLQEEGDGAMLREQVLDMTRKALKHAVPNINDKLTVKCHCGGVHLLVDRANYKENPHNVKARYIPTNKDKYHAAYCTCRSCRLATGYSLQPMAYVPPGAIRNAKSGEPVAFGDEALKEGANEGLKLGHYRASEQAQRSFCKGCGATVFYAYLGDDGDGAVDISVGILRAESGAMAREWLEWKEGHISWEEEAVDRSQVEGVKKGWGALGLGQ